MTGVLPLQDIAAVQSRLAWMREAHIWPNGLRYLWTDAFGVVLLVSLDAVHGLVVYHLLDPAGLAPAIADLKSLVETSYRALTITQDLGLAMLDPMWVDPPGYFCREPTSRHVEFAFANYGVSLGLQAVPAHGDRVRRLNAFFDSNRSGDEYDTNAITHVMACTSHFPGRFLRPAVP